MERYKALREHMRDLERKMRLLESYPEWHNISLTQFHAIAEIGRAKTLSLIQLAGVLGLDTSTVSRTVDGLVKAQLVNRENDPSNRRYISISLSKDGKKVFRDIETSMNQQYRRILQLIPKEKQGAVIGSIKIIISAINSSALEAESGAK